MAHTVALSARLLDQSSRYTDSDDPAWELICRQPGGGAAKQPGSITLAAAVHRRRGAGAAAGCRRAIRAGLRAAQLVINQPAVTNQQAGGWPGLHQARETRVERCSVRDVQVVVVY